MHGRCEHEKRFPTVGDLVLCQPPTDVVWSRFLYLIRWTRGERVIIGSKITVWMESRAVRERGSGRICVVLFPKRSTSPRRCVWSARARKALRPCPAKPFPVKTPSQTLLSVSEPNYLQLSASHTACSSEQCTGTGRNCPENVTSYLIIPRGMKKQIVRLSSFKCDRLKCFLNACFAGDDGHPWKERVMKVHDQIEYFDFCTLRF